MGDFYFWTSRENLTRKSYLFCGFSFYIFFICFTLLDRSCYCRSPTDRTSLFRPMSLSQEDFSWRIGNPEGRNPTDIVCFKQVSLFISYNVIICIDDWYERHSWEKICNYRISWYICGVSTLESVSSKVLVLRGPFFYGNFVYSMTFLISAMEEIYSWGKLDHFL